MPISDILVLGYFFGYYEKFFGYFWLLLGVSSATWLRHHLASLSVSPSVGPSVPHELNFWLKWNKIALRIWNYREMLRIPFRTKRKNCNSEIWWKVICMYIFWKPVKNCTRWYTWILLAIFHFDINKQFLREVACTRWCNKRSNLLPRKYVRDTFSLWYLGF